MTWDSLRSDWRYRIPVQLVVDSYLLKTHGFTVPGKRSGKPEGVTITGVPLLHQYDDAKEYVRNTTSDGFIPHFYDGLRATWQVLDLDDCWQRADGTANDKTICIAAVISDSEFKFLENTVAFRDIQKITAYVLDKYGLTLANVKVSKDCPKYITTQWQEFKKGVRLWQDT